MTMRGPTSSARHRQQPGSVPIRDFEPGDEAALRQVFMSSVHQLARGFYSEAQLNAWAPHAYDAQQWAERIRAMHPFIATVEGCLAGYADLQPSGYIDHFFVAARFSGRGVGSALMDHLHSVAARRRTSVLSAHVSLSAETFFARQGFSVAQRQSVAIHGVSLRNALMTKPLPTDD